MYILEYYIKKYYFLLKLLMKKYKISLYNDIFKLITSRTLNQLLDLLVRLDSSRGAMVRYMHLGEINYMCTTVKK